MSIFFCLFLVAKKKGIHWNVAKVVERANHSKLMDFLVCPMSATCFPHSCEWGPECIDRLLQAPSISNRSTTRTSQCRPSPPPCWDTTWVSYCLKRFLSALHLHISSDLDLMKLRSAPVWWLQPFFINCNKSHLKAEVCEDLQAV